MKMRTEIDRILGASQASKKFEIIFNLEFNKKKIIYILNEHSH